MAYGASVHVNAEVYEERIKLAETSCPYEITLPIPIAARILEL